MIAPSWEDTIQKINASRLACTRHLQTLKQERRIAKQNAGVKLQKCRRMELMLRRNSTTAVWSSVMVLFNNAREPMLTVQNTEGMTQVTNANKPA